MSSHIEYEVLPFPKEKDIHLRPKDVGNAFFCSIFARKANINITVCKSKVINRTIKRGICDKKLRRRGFSLA